MENVFIGSVGEEWSRDSRLKMPRSSAGDFLEDV